MRRGLVVSCLLFACSPSPRSSPGGYAAGATDTPPHFVDAAPLFPTAPIIDPGAPMNSGDLFGDPSTGVAGGPCVAEPADGTLLPKSFLRQRFRLVPSSGENLFEIRLRTPTIDHDLVAYTTSPTWVIPQTTWDAMNVELVDQPIEYRIRAAHLNGTTITGQPLLGATGTFRIAPVAASGTIVYWTSGTGGNAPAFKGFQMGDETVSGVMTPANVGGGVVCVGCHTSTPDGKYVGFSANPDPVLGQLAHVDIRSLDGTATRPPFLTPSAQTLLDRAPNQQAPVYSAAHWTAGDHVMLSMYPVANRASIVWTNLEATSTAEGVGWGVVARDGDTGQAGAGVWSHDGQTIAYSSAPMVTSGMNLDSGHGDLYTVPFNGGAGGAATPLTGASDPNYSESYAAFSSDDALIRVRPGRSGPEPVQQPRRRGLCRAEGRWDPDAPHRERPEGVHGDGQPRRRKLVAEVVAEHVGRQQHPLLLLADVLVEPEPERHPAALRRAGHRRRERRDHHVSGPCTCGISRPTSATTLRRGTTSTSSSERTHGPTSCYSLARAIRRARGDHRGCVRGGTRHRRACAGRRAVAAPRHDDPREQGHRAVRLPRRRAVGPAPPAPVPRLEPARRDVRAARHARRRDLPQPLVVDAATTAGRWIETAVVVPANLLGVLGFWMMSRAWYVGGIALPGTHATRRLVRAAAATMAVSIMLPAIWVYAPGLPTGSPMAIMGVGDAIADAIAISLIAPVLLTALALRGTAIAWPWALLTASSFGWLCYDATFSISAAVDTNGESFRALGEAFRALSCVGAGMAGIAQHLVVSAAPPRRGVIGARGAWHAGIA